MNGRAQHCGNATWGENRAFAYNAIHIDIDAHGTNVNDGRTTIDAICYALPDAGIPSPNVIEASGRGYHLVWYIDQVAATLGWMVEAVSVFFARKIQELMATSGVKGYQVDIGYASNIAGLTRIPGTYNTAAGTYASYQMLHAVRMDLSKVYDSISYAGQSHVTRTVSHTASAASAADTTSIGKKRVAALLRLHELRPIQVSQRDVYILHLYSAAQYAGMSNQDALALVKSVNQSFAIPLSDREVERYMSSAARKRYKYTTERMISDLDITPSEQESIGLHTGTCKRDSNRARNARVAAKRQKRDRAIMRLHLLGLAPTVIAKKVGHACYTVRSVICKYKDNLSDIFSGHELRLLFKQAIHQFVEGCHKVREQTSFKNGSAIYYAYAADKETVLSWLVKGKSWTDARPVAPAVTGASFVKTPAAIRLEVQAPADMSNIEKFRLELKDSDGNWVDYGTFRGGVPINGDGLNGTYTRLRITSIPKDSSAYRPGVFKMDCMLTVTNTSGTAPDSVTFSRVTNATVEPGYCVQAEGLSADTMHVVAELAERENGDGMRSYMGGNAFFNETSSGKSINITLFDDFLSKLIPGGYYRILEVKQASVPDSATASLTVNTRGGWEKIPALGSITYGPVSDLHFTEEDYPVLTWTRPSVEVPGTRYCVYLSTDGGANWTFAHAARERDFLPLYLFVGGDYNGVKVTTEISGQEVASCISTDLSLHITRNDKTSTASLSVEPVTGGGYLYTVTSLSPRTNYTLFFGNAPGQFNSSRGFRTDSDGTWTRILDDPSGTRYGYYYIQEYSACAVSVDGKTASLTVSGCGGWQQV